MAELSFTEVIKVMAEKDSTLQWHSEHPQQICLHKGNKIQVFNVKIIFLKFYLRDRGVTLTTHPHLEVKYE
jgi:hypothetical protein